MPKWNFTATIETHITLLPDWKILKSHYPLESGSKESKTKMTNQATENNVDWIQKGEFYFMHDNEMISDYSCPIWGTQVSVQRISNDSVLITSPRTGGKYKIDKNTSEELYSNDSRDIQIRLTTILVDNRINGTSVPTVSRSSIEEARKSLPLPVWIRADRVIRYFSLVSTSINILIDIESKYRISR